MEAQVLSLMKEIDPLHAEIEKIDTYRLSAEIKETINQLCKNKPLLDKDLERIERELLEKDNELQLKNEQVNLIPNLPNIAELEVVIDKVKRAGDIEQSLTMLIKDSEQKEMEIKEEIRMLPQWEGPYQELIELPVPGLSETVKKFEKEHTDLIQKLQKTQEQLDHQKIIIEGNEERIRELESLVEIPSEEKLVNVRSHRDLGWKLIRAKLEQGVGDSEQLVAYAKGQNIEKIYENHVRDADHIADTMRVEAAKVGEKNKLVSDIESCKKKITELEQEENRLKEEWITWESAWQKLWEPSGISPLTPEEMKEWLTKHGQIKSIVHEYVKTVTTIHGLENDKEQFKQALITALDQLVPVSKNQSLDELLSIAEKQQKEIQDHINKRNSLEATIREMTDKIKVLTNEKLVIETKISNWKTDWVRAIQGTDISENTSPSVAERLLSKYESCTQAYDDYKKVEQQHQSIQEQIIRYEEKVKNVLQTGSIPTDEQNVDIAVNQLNTALQKARQDQITMTNLKDQLEKHQLRIKDITNEMNEAESILQDLIKEAKCNTIEELKEVEKIFSVKKEYVSKIQEIEEELLELGNGQSLQEIIEEADQYKLVSIEVELDEIKRKLDAIELDRSPVGTSSRCGEKGI